MAIYPGSFDPITNGHLDLIQRGSALFDRLIVAILRNDEKLPLFGVGERIEMLNEVIGDLPNVEVGSFGGLLVDYASERGALLYQLAPGERSYPAGRKHRGSRSAVD